MDVKNVEKKDNGKLSFQVEIDNATFEAAVNKAYLKAKHSISIPGFRKGKVPRMIVENMYGSDVFHEDAVTDLAPEAFEFGVDKSGVKTVGRPTITNYKLNDDKSMSIDFSIAMYPEVTLGKYQGLEVYKEKCTVSADEVNQELEKVQKRNARIVEVDRAAKNGDTVNIDYDGYKDGVRFDGGKDEGHDLVLGSNSFVPGFEEQLVGVKAGESKDLNVTFPKEYYEGLAGAQVVFKVKVNEVKETQLPDLDDEFAKDVSKFDTLKEYKADLKQTLLKAKQDNAENDFHSAILDAASENMTATLPEEMIDEQVDNMLEDYKRNVAMQGMDFNQYLSMMGMDENSFRGLMRPSAEKQAKNEVLLEAVAEAEKIIATDEEIEDDFKKAAESYGVDIEKVKAAISAELVTRDIKMRKAAQLIYSSAVATDKKPEPENADAEAKPAKKSAAKKTAAATEQKAEKKPAAKKTSDDAPAKKTAAAPAKKTAAAAKKTEADAPAKPARKTAAKKTAEPAAEAPEKKTATKKTTKKADA